ncbi:MAG: hypothetical protein IT233_08340 [Bacteroidia bacterium]|nr:hypothetical protein [Bacteroidia bacterium]
MRPYILLLFTLTAFRLAGQDDLEKMMQELDTTPDAKVFATFKATKIINAQSTETVKKGTLDFCVTHRFGNIGTGSGGGGHTLYGFDESSDIRLSFDYGITPTLSAGFARSKRRENLDATLKWRFLEQTQHDIPLSLCLFANAAFSPMKAGQFYIGVHDSFERKLSHRMVFTSQLIIARKFSSRLSLELIGSYTHRNFIRESYNSNNVADVNGVPAAGIAGRFKLSRRTSVVFDYFYPLSAYYKGRDFTEHPLSIGLEIETGGHVFHLNFTNASGILESYFIPNTSDDWLEGGFKFGFNISRVFTIVKPKM